MYGLIYVLFFTFPSEAAALLAPDIWYCTEVQDPCVNGSSCLPENLVDSEQFNRFREV